MSSIRNRYSFANLEEVLELPDLISVQRESYKWFLEEGLAETFRDISPITDFSETLQLELEFDPRDEDLNPGPKYTVAECKANQISYTSPILVRARFGNRDTGELKEQIVFIGEFPKMTEDGTFVINGTERVVVSQLVRSPGVIFQPGERYRLRNLARNQLVTGTIHPYRGEWIEFDVEQKPGKDPTAGTRIARKRRLSIFTLMRALGFDEENHPNFLPSFVKHFDFLEPQYLKELEKVSDENIQEEALLEIYKRVRPGEPQNLDAARNYFRNAFFESRRYDLSRVGRYKLNRKLGPEIDRIEELFGVELERPAEDATVLSPSEVIATCTYLLHLMKFEPGYRLDDQDHFANRRIRSVGELIQNQVRIGLSRMERVVRERMTTQDVEGITPTSLINIRPVVASIKEFFGTSQLSQFMDQVNPLSGLTHRRRLSALGPGGLSRERAGFEVRDVHFSHYGRMCPIETPEGPNIGLIGALASYGKVNDFGFIESPYRIVKNGRVSDEVRYLAADEEEEYVVAQANAPIDSKGNFVNDRVLVRRSPQAATLQGLKTALEQEVFFGATTEISYVAPEEVQLMDVSPRQIVSVATALIPFLEHDDANRALMGANMQRQAVPLLQSEAPYIGTGIEQRAAFDAADMIIAEGNGVIAEITGNSITVEYEAEKTLGRKTYKLKKFQRSNQDTCINQKPLIQEGDRIRKGDVLADGPSTDLGELALGKNLLVAFMPWKGYNFEDAIVISEKVVRDDVFTSIHIDEYSLEVRDTKRGMEELTADIPNVSEEATKDLDENGLIRVGAEIKEGDILIGKITPKGETDPSPEEKLLRAIFGDKAGDVKDASLKAGPSLRGVVIQKKLFSRAVKDRKSKSQDKPLLETIDTEYQGDLVALKAKLAEKLIKIVGDKKSTGVYNNFKEELIKKGSKFSVKSLTSLDYSIVNPLNWTSDDKVNQLISRVIHNYNIKANDLLGNYKRRKFHISVGDELPAGIIKLAKVYVAKKRKLKVGDKMAGRHGNKGIVANIVRQEDMPFLEDGTPVDIVLNPLGVPSRMNLGQIYETVLGWAGEKLGMKFSTPIFDGATPAEIDEWTEKAGVPTSGKTYLFDGGTGERFHQPATVGVIYMLKLSHMVDDKMHARSIGPYSLITQQPLGGKAQFGGQRFGEMEVWALEAFGASNILQEILTVKSDDVTGRAKAYESIVKGDNIGEPGIPESFNVLLHELRGLCLNVTMD